MVRLKNWLLFSQVKELAVSVRKEAIWARKMFWTVKRVISLALWESRPVCLFV
jgi:hypothetical protein